MTLLDLAARVFLFVTFSVSAAGKLSSTYNFSTFRMTVGSMSGLHNRTATTLLALLVASLEVLAAILMVVPAAHAVATGFLLALGLLLAFELAIARTIRRGIAVPCHCFSASQETPVGSQDLARNAALVGVAAVGLYTAQGMPNATWDGGLVAALCAAIVAWLLVNLDDLLWLAHPPGSTARARQRS